MISEKFEDIISKKPTELSQSELLELQAYCSSRSFTLEQWIDVSVILICFRPPSLKPIQTNATKCSPSWTSMNYQNQPTMIMCTKSQKLPSIIISRDSSSLKLPGSVVHSLYSIQRVVLEID